MQLKLFRMPEIRDHNSYHNKAVDKGILSSLFQGFQNGVTILKIALICVKSNQAEIVHLCCTLKIC